MPAPDTDWQRYRLVVCALCVFIACLSFKPSEPYLSEFLICGYDTVAEGCAARSTDGACADADSCEWSGATCGAKPCSNVTAANCAGSALYCVVESSACTDRQCYKNFSEDEVNDEIYTWSTYFYLPSLLLLGPLAEIVSYKLAITLGIAARVGTRFLLIYGTTLQQMQLMQVLYAIGTAAEDIFSAYIFYALPPSLFQYATSLIKASALLSSLLAGILGDILVVVYDVPLTDLMIISAVSVCAGAILGLLIIGPSTSSRQRRAYAGVTSKAEQLVEVGLGESASIVSALHEGSSSPAEDTSVMLGASTPSLQAADSPPSERVVLAGAGLLRLQLRRLVGAFADSSDLRAFSLMWCVGNAVYTIVYSFEVTIYLDLQLAGGAATASDNWNGSVLSAMLLSGTLGALLPSAMKVNLMEEGRQMSLICLFLFVSCLWLLLFAIVWKLWASVVCIILYFFSWNFVNVVFYTHLGLAMVQQAGKATYRGCMEAEQEQQQDPPYSIAVVAVVAASVAIQIVLQGVLLSWLELSMRDISLVLSILFCGAALLFLTYRKIESLFS